MMIKKTLILILIVIAGITAAAAQSWTVYPLYNNTVDEMVETPSKLYYTSNGSLFSYDSDSGETYSYTTQNKLSDALVSKILYNTKHKFLLIVYKSGNMDVLYDNGRLVNLPEINTANLNVQKVINSINMLDDYICIATNFGYVLYDTDKLVVKESRNWNESISAVSILRGNLVLQYGNQMRFVPLDQPHTSLSDFRVFFERSPIDQYQVIGDELFLRFSSAKMVYHLVNPNFTTLNYGLDNVISDHRRTDWFKPMADGYYIIDDSTLYTFDSEGKSTGKRQLPELFRKAPIAIWKSPDNIWHGSSDGIGRFDISGASPVVLSEYYRPEGASCQRVAYITQSADGERVYITNCGTMLTRTCGSDDINGWTNKQTTDMIEGGLIYNMNVDIPDDEFIMGRRGEGLVREDPEDPSIYYLASRYDGIRVIKDGKQLVQFSDGADAIAAKRDNASFCMPDSWGSNTYNFNFDRHGNLWVLNGTTFQGEDWTQSFISVLPAAKLRKPTEVKKSDWLHHQFPDTYRNYYGCWMEVCKHSDYIVMVSDSYYGGVLIIDTKGTSTIADDRQIHVNSFVDQDNNRYEPDIFMFVVEDQRGMIWVGTQDGIIEFDPKKAFDADFRCNRIKVPRNDGTNYADYLLAGEQINWISVDPANRKWVATQNSGIYLVSPTGDKILEHFNTDNSPLPTNTVNVIEASKRDNMVYMGTNYGPICYSSDASPAAENFDNVYAYPNPVRPDYTGWITITGLMDGSLVKITDASGSVVHQGRSEGGMVVWDGCNTGGERVRSGIYFVLASENGSGNGYSAVTKIMVIN